MEGFHFERLGEADLPMLHGWLLRPHVARWWGEPVSVADLRREWFPPQGPAAGERAFIARFDGRPIGFVQQYRAMGAGDGWWSDETDPDVHGVDLFLADEGLLGRGLGRAMVRSYVTQMFRDPAVTVVQADPQPGNGRAVRCYAAAGFVPQGVVSTPDGPALLMRCTRASLALLAAVEA